MTRSVILVETLDGEDHPDWNVRTHKIDAELIDAFEVLPKVVADDGVHFRPSSFAIWTEALRSIRVRADYDRPLRLLRLLETEESFWILIHEPPMWGPLGWVKNRSGLADQ